MANEYDNNELKSEVTSLFGVTFRKDQIPVTEDGRPIYNPELVVLPDGKVSEQAVVELNDGTTVRFPKQDDNSKASIIIDKVSNTVRYSNINGLTVWDTPRDDKYLFNNCTGTVNAKREKVTTITQTSPSTFIPVYSYNNVSSKDRDKIWVNSKSNMNINYTQGYDRVFYTHP